MMVALILAQLVLPGPPSGPIQPPGMICLGECAGPVVWGPAERGRLVVACDMRSDTCSDGRKITTTRATPVPCEVSPGVWEMVPENTACISYRGLEAWRENTSYLAYGAQLDHALWTGVATATKVGAHYLVCGETFGAYRQRLAQEEGGVVRTSACLVRAGTSNRIRFLSADITSGGVNYDYTLTGEWQTVIATATVREEGGVAGVRLHPATAGAGCIDVAGCWSVRGDIPGRACWGGEAPVTCAADRHTISTEGWPTESGEISISFRVDEWAPGTRGYIVDGRTSGDTSHTILLITTDGRLRLDLVAGAGQALGPVVSLGEDHTVRLKVENGRTLVFYDGAKVIDVAGTPTWSHAAHIGHSLIAAEHLNGSIRSLTVRSFE